ncbi:hypothetical protein D3C76_1162840 [compost metagenome]
MAGSYWGLILAPSCLPSKPSWFCMMASLSMDCSVSIMPLKPSAAETPSLCLPS